MVGLADSRSGGKVWLADSMADLARRAPRPGEQPGRVPAHPHGAARSGVIHHGGQRPRLPSCPRPGEHR